MTLRNQVLAACRGLLSEINRDPASPTCGCLDRRYWAWKTIDFPEATFQRSLSALAWLAGQPEGRDSQAFLKETVKQGLLYTCRIQHKNGSFDQAYPHEQSYGATAFLLPDLLDAYLPIRGQCTQAEQARIEVMLSRSAAFLHRRTELHGYISNHLAGAALALLKASAFFKKQEYADKAHEITASILENQSTEGWYVEYGGADPGYQSLCMYYLAQFYQMAPSPELKASLSASLDFLQYFVHPDGTFGGEYGSRRTEVYYPGGIALLSDEIPAAEAISERMLAAIENGETVTLNDIDMGNTAPLLNSTIKALDWHKSKVDFKLPYTQSAVYKDFCQAGLLVRSTGKYYCVVGDSNGGVLKIFRKKGASGKIVLDDCGLIGTTGSGELISTQLSDPDSRGKAQQDRIETGGGFSYIHSTLPSPFNFALLRLMNLTIMRIGFLNELVKKALVKLLISGNKHAPLKRKREIVFKPSSIQITDRIEKSGNIQLDKLFYGGKFSSIHMASSRYFTPAQSQKMDFPPLDADELNQNSSLESHFEVKLS